MSMEIPKQVTMTLQWFRTRNIKYTLKSTIHFEHIATSHFSGLAKMCPNPLNKDQMYMIPIMKSTTPNQIENILTKISLQCWKTLKTPRCSWFLMGHYIEEIVFLTTKHLVINIVLNTFEYEQGRDSTWILRDVSQRSKFLSVLSVFTFRQ